MSFSRSKFNRRNFYIQEINLAQALGIGRGRLDEIVETLQSSDDENIRIKELVHFKVQGYVNKYPKRTFSREGAIAIAKYLDTQTEITTPALNKVLELVEQYRVNQIDVTVRQGVYENSSSLTVRRQRHWLSYEDVVKIFKSSFQRALPKGNA